ncbi:ATP-dependent protease ATPase subunit HslU [Candidatus Acetothermia bacterium]|nr:ATP-dependent protease ATPase subunit HslU [Candidatus Acetothermia bacterium]
MDDLSPAQIVAELDKYIIGQAEAKKAVAIALRNRLRRQRVQGDIKEEITPKNILMIGPTGVGKTEISRRLALLTNCPFLKVEATKFTEIGYVGRDVDSMIRDLAEASINMVKQEEIKRVEVEAKKHVEEKLLDALVGAAPPPGADPERKEEREESWRRTREKFRERLRGGELEETPVEIMARREHPFQNVNVISSEGFEQMGIDMSELLGNMMPPQMAKKRVKIREARQILFQQEADKLINQEEIRRRGIKRAEETGIVFLDEIDKIAAGGREERHGPGVSRQGVQRDLLPILEGSNVRTRYGTVNTENILFIAAGAFTMAKPSDLIPELQGRLPIRVELKDALEAIADIAFRLNERLENIGARRLHTVMEKLMEDISFEMYNLPSPKTITIDANYVQEKLKGISEDVDLSRYIL